MMVWVLSRAASFQRRQYQFQGAASPGIWLERNSCFTFKGVTVDTIALFSRTTSSPSSDFSLQEAPMMIHWPSRGFLVQFCLLQRRNLILICNPSFQSSNQDI